MSEKLVFEARIFSIVDKEEGEATLRLEGNFDSLDLLKKVISEVISFLNGGIVDIIIVTRGVSFLSSYASGMFLALELLLQIHEGSLTFSTNSATDEMLRRAGLSIL